MSLIAQAFDAVLKQYQDTDHLTMEDLFGHMEPAFAAEGYREPVSAQPQRILIVRLDEIGDCVLMIPMLRELRRAYPRAQIDLVVKSGPYPLMELCPYVNHVFVAEKLPRPGRPMREFFCWDRTFCEAHLWEQHYDLCLVPRWDIDETGAIVLAYFCGARQRIGFSEKCSPVKAEQDQGMNMLFTRPILTPLHVVHEVDKGLFLLRAGLGIRSERDDLEIWYRKSDADAAKQLLESGDVHGPYIAVASARARGARLIRLNCWRRHLRKYSTGCRSCFSADRVRKQRERKLPRCSRKRMSQCSTSSEKRRSASRRHSLRWRGSIWAVTRGSRILRQRQGDPSSSGSAIRSICP